MTKSAKEWDKKIKKKLKNIWEAESNTWEQWIYLLGIEKHVYQKAYSK